MTSKRQCKTGKVRYESFGEADSALRTIRAKPVDPSNFFDAYRPNYVRSCPKCGGFHLSSNQGKQFKSGKRGRNLRVGRR